MTRAFALALAFLVGMPHLAGAEVTKQAKKSHKKKRAISQKWVSRPDDPLSTPAFRYGQLTEEECLAELTTRDIPFERETALGVLAPVRITGPLRGVTYRTSQSEEKRATSPWEIGDCRLVLALDDFAEILRRYDIVEVRHYSMYRAPSKSWPEEKIGNRHNGAVAIDAGRFIASDGSYLDVDKHFSGRIGAKACGDGARPRRATKEALELRSILCEAVDAYLFNIILTPNYNRPHKNHFHMEVTGAQWFLLH